MGPFIFLILAFSSPPSKQKMSRPGETYQDAQLTYHNLGYNVKFKIEIENLTSENIETISILPHIGYVKTKPPQVIAAGMKDCMVGHKVGDTATGCVGVAAFKIGSDDDTVCIMYSIPYDQNLYSNWLAVGITDNDRVPLTGNTLFNKMYYETEDFFKRKDFYYDSNEVSFERGDFKVTGEMTKHHRCEITIKISEKVGEARPNYLVFWSWLRCNGS